jgi:quinol monooxygenase YgiN
VNVAYVVSAVWRAKEGKADRLLEVIREMTPPSRAEEGNVFYQAQRAVDDPNVFYLYEQYVDEAGYQAHMDSEHFTRLVKGEAIPELLESRERAFYETIDDAAGGLGEPGLSATPATRSAGHDPGGA